MPSDEVTAERVRRVLGRRKFRETRLMGGLCFMVGGSMCCSISGKGGLLIRVGADRYESALTEPHVAPMRMGRRTTRGFVRVAPEGYQTDQALERWIALGLEAAAARSPRSETRVKIRKSA